jgi:predicted ester cyclase
MLAATQGSERRSLVADNKEIVRRLAEEPWSGNFEVIDELASPNYVGYDPAQPEPTRGPEGLKEFVQGFLAGYPDGRVTIDQQLAEGDYVASRWTGRGTHNGELMGIAATGRQVTVTGITISRLEGGQVVEEWTNWDTLGMLQQLGAIPAGEGAKTA